MRFYLLVASKFLSSNSGVGRFTGIISKLGIAVGSFALVIAISVLNGFEMQVNKKIRDLIHEAYNEKISKLIIVTGKGLHSQNEKDPYVSKDLGILKY